MGKYHDHCSCIAVASFDDEGLEGHDAKVDEWRSMWDAASDSLPDKATRDAWEKMSQAEQAAYQRTDHPTWDPYANYRTHMLMARMRDMYGIDS